MNDKVEISTEYPTFDIHDKDFKWLPGIRFTGPKFTGEQLNSFREFGNERRK